MNFRCGFPNCTALLCNYDWYIKHVWDNHGLTPGFSYKCDVSSCQSKFIVARCYRRHLREKHKDFHNQYLGGGTKLLAQEDASVSNTSATLHTNTTLHTNNDDTLNINDEAINEVNDASGSGIHQYDKGFDYETTVADMLLHLREKHGVTNDGLTFVAEKMILLLKHDNLIRSKKVSHSLNESKIDLDFQSDFLMNSDSPFIRHLESFSNTQTLDRFIEKKSNYVAPIEQNLDGKDKFYYIPILKTLRQLLAKEDVIGEVLNHGNGKKPGVITDFSDGELFKENKLYMEKPKSLQINLYHDDFQNNNALGNKAKKGKLSGFYFVLGNLKHEHRSRLKDIHLLTMTKATHIDKYGYGRVLAPLLKDLKSLESKGLTFKFDDVSMKVYGTISMVIGDNLALHALGGFYQNFSTVQRFCRFCNRTMNSINDHTICDVLRTKEAYDCQVALVVTNSEMIPLYGIKRPCVLNQLSYFHIVDGAPGDIAHDVFEGVAQEYICQVLVQFIKDKLLTLDQVNELILNFQYADIDKRNKPQQIKQKPLTKLKLKQTACEMWNFIRLFPLIFGQYVIESNIHWKLCISFVNLVEKLCAHAFNDDSLSNLDEKIDEFIKGYSKLYPDNNVKPKLHFITHYPVNIKKFGPLVKTLRFESKHSYFKRSIANSRNRVNVSYSMARHHQMLMYMEYKKKQYFNESIELTSSKEVKISELPFRMQSAIIQSPYIYSDTLMEASKMSFKGQTYCQGCAVVLGKTNELLLGEVITTFVCADIPLVLCDKLFSSFHPHFNAFSVRRTNEYVLLRIADLYDFHPLGIYQINHQWYVNLIHSML